MFVKMNNEQPKSVERLCEENAALNEQVAQLRKQLDDKSAVTFANAPPYVRPPPFTFGNICHVPPELIAHHKALEDERAAARMADPALQPTPDMSKEQRRALNKRRRRAKWEYPDGSIIIDPVALAYMQFHGLSDEDWDAERNGPKRSRLFTWNYEFHAALYPYQYMPIRNRDPTKFIHVLLLCQRETYLQFFIRHSALDNSQFDALDFVAFPERIIRTPPPRFWHWVAGEFPHVEWDRDDGVHEFITIDGYPKFTPNEFHLQDHPHEIGLLSNRRYDGSIIDESRGDVRNEGIYLFSCEMFVPVPRHDISHWFIFRFPYSPTRRDPRSNLPKPETPKRATKRAKVDSQLGEEKQEEKKDGDEKK